MPVPVGQVSPDVAAYLEALEGRVAAVEDPQQPSKVYACATVDMPDAAVFVNCVLRNTTLDILAVSNGANWIRQDTGAAI